MNKILFALIVLTTLFSTTSCKKENNFLQKTSNSSKTNLYVDEFNLPTANVKDTPYGNLIIVDTPYTSLLVDTPYTKK